MKTRKVILKISAWAILFLYGCISTPKVDEQVINDLNNYSGKTEELKNILYDYSTISKNKEHFRAYKEILLELSSFVKKHSPEVEYELVEKRDEGDVYAIIDSSEKSNRRHVLVRDNKIVSPQCFLKGDEITFCF